MFRRFALLLGLAVLLAAPHAARAHIPPPVWMSIEITDEAVTWEVVMEEAVYTDWFGGPPKPLADAAPEEQKALREQAERFLSRFVELRIDRVPVKGALADLTRTVTDVHGADYVYATVKTTFETKGRPREVDLVFKKYDSAAGWTLKGIETEIEAYGEADYILFSKTEPEYVWHAPRVKKVANPFVRPPVPVPPSVPIPLVSVGILLAGLLAFPLFRSRPRLRLTAVGIALILAVVLSGIGRAEVRLPWGPRFVRPTEEEAKEIFAALHRNIYRAFDHEKEEDIYDTLRLSVTGDLLDDIYTEVYQSLIDREQGGVVMKIQSTKILATEIAFPGNPKEPWFSVACRWQVRGKISHWGHTHLRVNEYQATFTLTLQEDGWRIARVEVTEQKRVDTRGYGRTPGNTEADQNK